jgi:hypothetical protein
MDAAASLFFEGSAPINSVQSQIDPVLICKPYLSVNISITPTSMLEISNFYLYWLPE